ncbi:MAG: SPOR domain-containing protein [Gemmatimonadetes bacterium]|nr:SPOR domain-containing protein [Gemmatimonadota bacterium]
MTVRVLAPLRLGEMVPPLFADRHLVILVPATANTEWAVQGAWAFARAASTGSRSVLLIDLSADGPMLDSGATGRASRGIADVFLTDEPLNEAASPQDAPGLFYIQRGARAGGFEPVWGSDRWAKLARGFASEGALLLLFAPPGALSYFPVEPDGLVVLAPQGYDPADGTFPHIAKRVEQGTPLLAVVGEETKRPSGGVRTSSASQRPPARRSSAGVRRPAAGGGRFRYVTAALVALAAVASAVAVWAGRPSAAVTPARGQAYVAAPLDADAGAGDSLYYSVQVAAFNTLEQAMTRAAELEGDGAPAIVTPVRMGGQGTWYRVLTGALPSARAADSLLQSLWQSRRIERPQGTILRTSETYRVGRRVPVADAEVDARGLRARGIPAYIVGAPDGTARVYVGAFDLPEQAHAVDSLLTTAGLTGTLVQRMGTTP